MKKLNIYCTACFPKLNDTLPMMKVLEQAGADIIELGMPYSDPVADGPVIQEAGKVAINNGFTIPLLLAQLENMRNHITVPVYLMGYFNPVMQYGMESFVKKVAATGITGVILPDLPPHVYEKNYKQLFAAHNLKFVCLVTPETSEERIKYLDGISSGFLYAVSSSSTTGKNKDLGAQEDYFKRLSSLGLKNEILVGFGIKDKESFDMVTKHADGGIIGSAFIKTVQENLADWQIAAKQFIDTIK